MSKFRFIFYSVLSLIFLFILNSFIFVKILNDKRRAQLLRFQLSCIIVCGLCMMSVFVWKNISSLFDRPLAAAAQEKMSTPGATLDFNPLKNWKRLTVGSRLWRISLLVILVSSTFSYTTFSLFTTTYPYKISVWLFICYGLVLQLFFGSVCMKVISFGLKYIFRYRRPKLERFKQAVIVVYSFFIVSVGFQNAMQPPALTYLSIPVKNLPGSLEKMTITLLADIHLGPTIGKDSFEKVVHMTNYLNSDIVIIAGDLVDGTVAHLRSAVEPLEWIKAKYGIFFVTGNHEYYTADIHAWMRELQSMGVKLLHNTHTWVPSPNQPDICITGVDDPTADSYRIGNHSMDVDLALKSCDPVKPVILVSHQPAGAQAALQSGYRVDLILSGHTHGGQMFPLTIAAYLFNPFYAGLYRQGYSHVYVSMGTLTWGFPIRFGTRTEITKITLVKWTEDL